jgi:hypothetical protein
VSSAFPSGEFCHSGSMGFATGEAVTDLSTYNRSTLNRLGLSRLQRSLVCVSARRNGRFRGGSYVDLGVRDV